MISLRSTIRRNPLSTLLYRSSSSSTALTQTQISSENDKARAALEAEKSSVQKYIEQTRHLDPSMVWGTTIPPPDPPLPANPSEISALDPAHMNQDPLSLSGSKRKVHIKQYSAKASQAPTDIEQTWTISFCDEEESSQTWDNPLMGWTSSSDPMANNMRLQLPFRNASDAVYFAKKRGWDYVVDKPIVRLGRDDDAQYQDCFLSQAVAARVRREKKNCDQWFREESGTSHYRRPLKYHGDGEVRQHGPNYNQDVAPHVPGYYKMR